MSKDKKTEVAVQAPINPPAVQHARTSGLAGNIDQSDMRLPRIALTQSKSPTVEEGIHKQGIFINSLTKEEIKDAVIVPVLVFKSVIRWKPRAEGGGIIYKTTNITDDVKEDLKWRGDQKPLATAYINAVCLVEGEDMPLIASFSMTSYKAGQDLATLVSLSKSAWDYKYKLGVKKESKTTGSYFIFTVARGAKTTDEEKQRAAELAQIVSNMAIDTDYEGGHAEQASITDDDNKDNL